MSKKDSSKEIIERYINGMHPNEIAARMLLEVGMVMDVIEEYERNSKNDLELEAGRAFVEEELKKGIVSMSCRMEELFRERQFEHYNKAYENWLDSIKTYVKLLKKED